ncbi:polysaccharide deacetylase [Paenibacillus sp. N1-5-1-14]|nr:polysaccharide deacetylase [Paenibacillus radicibacter]
MSSSTNDQVNKETEQQKKPDFKPEGKVVYLTFDDGPTKYTSKFLDVLKQHGVKATFFMTGNNLSTVGYQPNVKRAIDEGHYVGAHSMTHNSKKLYNEGMFVPEMKETIQLIQSITGERPKLVRPPYGSAPGLKPQQVRDQLAQSGIKVWDWTIDSNDWNLRGKPDKIIETIKAQTKRDVEVVLMHEQPQTLQALPQIIEFYKKKGYKFAVYKESEHFSLNFQKDDRL